MSEICKCGHAKNVHIYGRTWCRENVEGNDGVCPCKMFERAAEPAAPKDEPQCTGPFSDAWDCPVHRPNLIPTTQPVAPAEDERCDAVSVQGIRCCRPKDHVSDMHVEDDEGQADIKIWNREPNRQAEPAAPKDEPCRTCGGAEIVLLREAPDGPVIGQAPCPICNKPATQPAPAVPPSELEQIANMLEEIWGLPESAATVRAAEAEIALLRQQLAEAERRYSDAAEIVGGLEVKLGDVKRERDEIGRAHV